jgi:hypothetical protein
VSPSDTAWPSSQAISLTVPSSSASTGISIFIDSRMTSVSPSAISWPTSHSIFHTVPVMWASTSGKSSSSRGLSTETAGGAAPYRSVAAELGVIVTARNEADRLGETLAALRSGLTGARILVADDASADATGELARADGAEGVRAARPLGKGGAATLAARRLLEDPMRAPRTVLLCDADLGASAVRLDTLVAALEQDEGDLIVAEFETRAGGGLGLALAASRALIARRTGGLRPRAPLSGQRALRARHLPTLLPFARGFGMETAMTIDAHRAGMRVAEVPVPLEHRATRRDPAGFLHRGRQLADVLRLVHGPRGR